MVAERSCSEMPVAKPLEPNETRPTVEAIVVMPEVSEPAVQMPPTDERVEGLLKELLVQLKERKALEDVAALRWARCSELLEEARTAKRLVAALLGDTDSPHGLWERLNSDRAADDAYDALKAWLDKPL